MSKSCYDEVSVVRNLSNKIGCSINVGQKEIKIAKDAINIGNGSWGKIDYLVNYCGYTKITIEAIERNNNKDFNNNNNIKAYSKRDSNDKCPSKGDIPLDVRSFNNSRLNNVRLSSMNI